ncbi:MAG: tetraacyldisaccharide 4'-kinase [Acidobacteriaceae bacterium]|nr:tetraacyldisaccharide 4'-kinase [Acidobacteriaceae bacterium]
MPQSFSRTAPGSVWLHAVSVGEVLSAPPLIRALRDHVPRAAIYLSTSTIAGRKAAEREVSGLVNGIFYAPIDYVSCIRRTLSAIRPSLLVILETEIWPNLYNEARRAGCGLALANARISGRAWPRYKLFCSFFRLILRLAQLVFVQSQTDYNRYRELGADPSRLSVEANLKYDAATASGLPPFGTFGAEHVWIAASTVGPNERGSIEKHDIDEDDLVIDTFAQLAKEFPKLLLILAPRQPARFDLVAAKLKKSGVSFLRRTHLLADSEALVALPGILLLDSLGELARAYNLAHVVFVGGSLAPRGGHNIIEPAAAGLPVVVGPHMENFEAITADFRESRALVQIANPAELCPSLCRLLINLSEARNLGNRARHLVELKRGASERIAEKLAALYFVSQYRTTYNFLSRQFLNVLAAIWRVGGDARRRRSERAASCAKPLGAPVISIGGITMGGSGKAPFTIYLAGRLKARHYNPAILTRGYRRRSPSANLILPSGTAARAAFTGDEAQIFLRAAVCPVGIGSSRYETGRILLAQIPQTDMLLLDDGFQHARLRRSVDIVLIDAFDPFGRYHVFPLGRLREPLSALSRADILVITRAETSLHFNAIKDQLRSYNNVAPVFRASLRIKGWRDGRTGSPIGQLPSSRVAAFCGLGSPANFFHALESLGLEIVFRWSFSDHHAYRPLEIARLAHQARLNGASVLVTTEKDTFNFPLEIDSVLQGLDVAWLEVEMRVEEESALFATIDRVLRHRASGPHTGSALR